MDDLTHTEEVLGIVRCARCGYRLNGEIECPFCTSLVASSERVPLPKWVYLTACFLTSPLSIYFIFSNDRLRSFEKILALSGCLLWFFLYRWISRGTWFLF
jgi:DNA-directed RNA polymerase subunit RPC12/RpoP